jgi:hypothetical protein
MTQKTFTIAATLFFLLVTVFSSCSKEEETIEKWIIGTWEIDRYVQENYDKGILMGDSESVDQGKIEFKTDGTGIDIGGNFIGGEFTWTNTDKSLGLTTGGGLTTYIIEEYSNYAFIFSITDVKGDNKDVERWYLSK